jgi:8-oxo-dGTP diphosphatase
VSSKPPIEVAAALIFRDGRLLITQRYPNAHLGGLWEFPGGKRELEESWPDCLVRELKEELGIEVKIGRLIESVTHPYPEKSVHLKFFQCMWLKHEPQPLGCPDFRWVTRAQLSQFSFPEADANLVAKLQSTDSFWEYPPGPLAAEKAEQL